MAAAAAGGWMTLMAAAAYNNSQEKKAEASQTSHQDRLKQPQEPEKKKGLSFATVASATIGVLLTGWAIYMFATGKNTGKPLAK